MSTNNARQEIDIKQHEIQIARKTIKMTEYKRIANINSVIKANLEQRFRYSLEDIAGKTVLIVGAGTLGNELIKNLILSGVTDITIVDNDSYVIENLPRSTLIEKTDIGKNKAEALAYRAALKSPFGTHIKAINSDILNLGWGFLETFDLIFSPVDNIATRYFLNKGALLTKKPHITLGTNFIGEHTFTGEIIFIPQEARACLECIWAIPASIELSKKLRCKGLDEKRELQPQVMCFSSIVSGIASHIGLKYLLGKSNSLDKSYHYIVANNGTVREFIQSDPHPKCSLHSRRLDINRIDTLKVSDCKTMDDLCKKMQYVFHHDITSFEIFLEWSEMHNVVYNPDNPINVLYLEMGDLNIIPDFLQMNHAYLILAREETKLIRLDFS